MTQQHTPVYLWLESVSNAPSTLTDGSLGYLRGPCGFPANSTTAGWSLSMKRLGCKYMSMAHIAPIRPNVGAYCQVLQYNL
ncbi:hypothetical protein BLL36_27190 [Pseudomonas cedrina subsp. cedrina]|uniref:Uncharacterized protein n=1 Tax=Pseudomonas cedrina subsp. cedrina TaxID=76762 RepID=A0A1V2JXA3_PSECE|nr:hypothetical protein BLL36_27190 [Pseudomonas cedrina subsp. cedrina]